MQGEGYGFATGGATILLMGIGLFLLCLFGISLWARRHIANDEDYLVAGRRLGLGLATPTLLATWVGAGTLLTASDAIRDGGVPQAALDPLGPGICLLLAGAFYASRLWSMRLLTLGDFFARRFGRATEVWASLLMVPTYIGWVAVQFVAIANILHLYFGLPVAAGIAVVAAVGTAYTLVGGMWSVTLTDAVQMVITLAGVAVLVWLAVDAAGGVGELVALTPPELLRPIPAGAGPALTWVGVFAAGALGNLPSPDLVQRMLSAKSAVVARRACYLAGAAYLVIGVAPIALGLAGRLLLPHPNMPVLSSLAQLLLSPWMGALFILSILSAVMSTIDSAILAPAGVLAENVVGPWLSGRGGAWAGLSRLTLSKCCVAVVAVASLAVAYIGERAWTILELSYEMGLVSILVPLTLGLYLRRGSGTAALTSMAVGTSAWGLHVALGWASFLQPWLAPVAVPQGLVCALLSLLGYLFVALRTGESVRTRSASL